MKKYLYIFSFCLINVCVFGQNLPLQNSCSISQTPMPTQDQAAYVKAMENDRSNYRMNGDSVIIPVVFHNMHYHHIGYVQDKAIVETVASINDALANRGDYQTDLGIDTRIRLCLAGVNPDGEKTTGITHQHNELAWNDDYYFITDFFEPIIWDTARYLNIYIADCEAGLSSLPWSQNISKFDGNIVNSDLITINSGISTFVHEIGHYLGLYHTFGKYNFQTNCANGFCLITNDEVCDTPPQLFTYTPFFEINSCDSDVNLDYPANPFTEDQLDMIDNYMSGGRWRTRFTQGQVDRMHWMLEIYRPNLTKNVEDRCSKCSSIELEINIPEQAQKVGEEFIINNETKGDVEYKWFLEDELISEQKELSYIPIQDGNKLLKLEASQPNNEACSSVWIWEKLIQFRCQPNISIEEPNRYFKDSCYVIRTSGMDDLHWWTNEESSTENDILFCPESSGIQQIIFEYGSGVCRQKDTLLLSVEDKSNLERRYWRGEWVFEDSTIYTPNVRRTRELSKNRIGVIGKKNTSYYSLATRKSFIRFMDKQGVLEEEWIPYYPDSIVNYSAYDFIEDEGGNIYLLGKVVHPLLTTSGQFFLAKINRFGKVDWSKGIEMPDYLDFRLSHELEIHPDEDNFLIKIRGYNITINSKGEIIETYDMKALPYEKYEEFLSAGLLSYDYTNEENVLFGGLVQIRDLNLYNDYDENLSQTYLHTYLIGSMNKKSKALKYKFYLRPGNDFSISSSVTTLKHPLGIIMYYKTRSLKNHRIVLFDNELNIIWEKEFKHNILNSTSRMQDSDVFVSNNGDIHIYNTNNRGGHLIYLHLNKEGTLLNHSTYYSRDELWVPDVISLVDEFHKAGIRMDDGYTVFSSLLGDSTGRLVVQHLPFDTSYFTCNNVDNPVEEIVDFIPLEESYLQEEIVVESANVYLEDIEFYIKKGFFQTEVLCEESYSLEDYILTEVNSIPFCPDSIYFDIQICRSENNSANADTTNMLVYESSPLETAVNLILEIPIIFENDEMCINYSYTGNAQDYSFMLNAKADYRTPFTLQESFFDGNQKLEWEYRNNYYDYISECDSIVSITTTISNEHKLKIFPNPAKEILNIELENETIQTLKIYNLMGQEVFIDKSQKDKIQLSTNRFTSGIYIIEVWTKSGGVLREKVMVE